MLIGSDIVAIGHVLVPIAHVEAIFVDNFQGKEFWVAIRTSNQSYEMYRISHIYKRFEDAEFQRRIIFNAVERRKWEEEHPSPLKRSYRFCVEKDQTALNIDECVFKHLINIDAFTDELPDV